MSQIDKEMRGSIEKGEIVSMMEHPEEVFDTGN